jgi:hypothetical protein
MNARRNAAADRRRRKLITGLWALGLSAVVIVLIVLEKTAILYILATLGVCALLGVVAMSDLAQSDKINDETSALKGDAVTIAKPISERR